MILICKYVLIKFLYYYRYYYPYIDSSFAVFFKWIRSAHEKGTICWQFLQILSMV